VIAVPDDVFVDAMADPESEDWAVPVVEFVEEADVDVWSDDDDGEVEPAAALVAAAALAARVPVEPTNAARLTNSVTSLARLAG
jgi:hypothetical protein